MINMKEGDEILNINQYIEERLNNQIQWYSQKSQHAQKMYKIFQVTEIIIAAAIPLLSGYATDCITIAIIVGILGAIIAIIETISKLFKWHENWIESRTTCELLKYHKYLYLTQSSPYNPTEETIDNLFVKNIIYTCINSISFTKFFIEYKISCSKIIIIIIIMVFISPLLP